MPLHEGAEGRDVALLQDMLTGLGFSIAHHEVAARRFRKATAEAAAAWQRRHELIATGALDLAALARLAEEARALPRIVRGVVALADGTPMPGLRVTAFDRDFRAEQALGEAITDRAGRYRIAYSAEAFARAEKGAADLGVRVTTANGKATLFVSASRDLLMQAPSEAVIDVTVALDGSAPTEFERIAAELRPLVGDVAFAEIAREPGSDEADFLARETGLSTDRIAHFIVADRLAGLAGVRAEHFYALLREDGLFGVAPGRPRAVLTPVGVQSDTRAVLLEAALLEPEAATAALRRAVRKRIVIADVEREADRSAAALERWRGEARDYVGRELPGRILGTVETLLAAGKAEQMRAFLGSYDMAEPGALFERLDAQGLFADANRGKAEARLQLTELLGFNLGLVEEVTASVGADTPEAVRKLAGLEREDWTGLIVRGAARIAPDAPPVDAALARRQSSIVVRSFEKAFPTAALTAQLSRQRPESVGEVDAVVELLEAHPELELRHHNLRPFLKEAGVDPAEPPPAVISEVEKLQRMFQLTGNYRQTEALLKAGYSASADIVAAGRQQFVADARQHAGMKKAEAVGVFEAAERTNLGAVMVATNLRTLSWPSALAGPSATAFTTQIQKILADQPDLASLFQSADACECRHCRSIYSPAAYFVDVVRFLRNRLVKDLTQPNAPSTKSATDILFGRCGYLRDIDLNCDNAHVEVPHIDLVSELMEEAVSPDPGLTHTGAIADGPAPAALIADVRLANFEIGDDATIYWPHAPDRYVMRDKTAVFAIDGPGPVWTVRRLRQTHGSSEERAAAPEYVNAAAYGMLAAAKAAFELPFDLAHTETRAFLAAAGVDRAALMTELAKGGVPSADEIAGETLGLSAGERSLIFAASVAAQPQIWGVPGPAAAPAMARLDLFTRKTGLDYREVEALLTGSYIRGGAGPSSVDLFIVHEDNSCNLAAKHIEHLDDIVLDRMHRLLRVARKTGLKPRDIDRLAASPRLGKGDLGGDALRSLAEVVRLAAELRVEPAEVITWIDVVPTDGDPSEHGLLFQNVAATGPLDPLLKPDAIAANQTGGSTPLSAVAADLAAGLGARQADVDLLRARLTAFTRFGANPLLSFDAIGAVHGRLGLAAALDMTPAELVGLEALVGMDPLPTLANLDPLAGAAELRRFVDIARNVQAAGVPVAELECRLARKAPDLAAWDLADGAIDPLFDKLGKEILAVAAANQPPYDPSLTAAAQAGALEALLKRQPALDAAAIAALVDMILLPTPGAAEAAAAASAIDQLQDMQNEAAAKANLNAILLAPTLESHRASLLQSLMFGLSLGAVHARAVDVAVAEVAALLRIAPEMAAIVIQGRAPLWRGAQLLAAMSLPPVADILARGTAVPLPGDKFQWNWTYSLADRRRAVRLVHAIAGLIAPFDPKPDTVAFMLEKGSALGWFVLERAPFETASPLIPISEWIELADAFSIFADYPPARIPGQPDQAVTPASLFELALGPPAGRAALLDGLALLTGWPRARIGDADTHFGLALAEYRKPATWRALGRAVALLHALAVPFTDALRFALPTLGDAERIDARRLLRARYPESEWLGALKAIMDPIREAKRNALVAYLLAANPGLTTEDLYDHFLTDTQWSAKMPSSRLVHAHFVLQLFIERCLAGLEPKATADVDGDRDWAMWEWMKNYRVWEVNRKVFVEAQYYIRPEWRDDKTEPFEEMEGALLQNEINEENIEAAYEGYLDGLDKIAFLDVLATCYDLDKDDLHVFACTKGGEPRSYYHRMLQRERVWTPWKKIDCDITGQHLVAFFRNKRLFLAWATFIEKGNEEQESVYPQPGSGPQPLPPAERWSEISLAISEYTGKKWLPRRVSDGVLATPPMVRSLDRNDIFLTVNPDPQRFTVDVHLNRNGLRRIGYFLVTGCKGYPEAVAAGTGHIALLPRFKDSSLRGQRFVEQGQDSDDELAMIGLGIGSGVQTLFGRTPGTFRISYPFQASELDRFLSVFLNAGGAFAGDVTNLLFGTLMPFFFEDNQRGYVLIPGFYGKADDFGVRRTAKTFSNVRRLFVDTAALANKYLLLLSQASNQAERDEVLRKLAADPEYARILAEYRSYRGTRLGIVARNFYHPMMCRLRERFFDGGPAAMLARATQLEVGPFQFGNMSTGHAPSAAILPPYPREELEFGRESAYAAYNWELTFHAPHLIAAKLIEAERFDEAETWLRYIFDPLGTPGDPKPQRYWNMKEFHLRGSAEYGAQLVSAILGKVAQDPTGAIETELIDSIVEWGRNPFKPYLVARSRTVVFQQAIVNLMIRLFIGRADQYFRRDQLEDLVMATLDYSRAERLLGPRPAVVPPSVEVPPETYAQLEGKLDHFGNALRTLENLIPDVSALPRGGAEFGFALPSLESLYFCIPPSEKMYELWDLLEERQFNLRNSRTIEGVERSLSLFAPPLSVEELIKAAAAGLSVSAILAGLSAPRPPYRFRVMLRHAVELAEAATGFSREMEQALASRDAEGLSRLKAQQEIRLLDEQTAMLEEEIKAAARAVESARKARSIHQQTQTFYSGRPYMHPLEIAANAAYGVSFGLQAVMAIGYIAAGGLALIPRFMIGAAGFGGSPTGNIQTGGDQISAGARDAMVGAISASAGAFEKAGSMLEHQANYAIRKEDWDHAAKTAAREVERADIEIAIAGIRETIAKEQLRLHKVRQQQAAAEEIYLKSKFTNREMFDWLSQELKGLSKRMFNLAFEAAKAAEHCFNFELGRTDSFITAGKWNDNRRGLLAAAHLSTDLRRMDSSYLKGNSREREIVQRVSLARLDPIALIQLRTTGRCTIVLPEALFDLPHPGHYFRRIKSVAFSLPCVAGPYSSVPLNVTQTSNRIRVATGGAYAETPGNDTRFRYNVGSVQSISTSRAEEDGGLFTLDFNDERYLPFEGSGLCGTFVVELPQTLRPFDYDTISDLVLTLSYTARDGGGSFRTKVATAVRERLNDIALAAGRTGLSQAFDLRRDRPNVWHKLVTHGQAALTVTPDDLPYFTSSESVTMTSVRVLARTTTPGDLRVNAVEPTLWGAAGPDLPGWHATSPAGPAFGAPLTLETLLPSKVDELIVVVGYKMDP